jgi:hypothetical protein
VLNVTQARRGSDQVSIGTATATRRCESIEARIASPAAAPGPVAFDRHLKINFKPD